MILLGLYLVAFTFLSVKYFRLAVQLFIITLPSYLIRFSIGPLPSTLLELEFGVIVLVWLVRYAKNDLPVIQTFFKQNRVFAAALGVFFIYLTFLRVLPFLLRKDNPIDEKGDKEGE